MLCVFYTVVCIISLKQKKYMFFSISPELKTSATICRFIVRDFCGKNCWDCCLLQSPDESLPDGYLLEIPVRGARAVTPLDALPESPKAGALEVGADGMDSEERDLATRDG